MVNGVIYRPLEKPVSLLRRPDLLAWIWQWNEISLIFILKGSVLRFFAMPYCPAQLSRCGREPRPCDTVQVDIMQRMPFSATPHSRVARRGDSTLISTDIFKLPLSSPLDDLTLTSCACYDPGFRPKRELIRYHIGNHRGFANLSIIHRTKIGNRHAAGLHCIRLSKKKI